MTDFLEFEENKKTIKKLNLEDLSIENLKDLPKNNLIVVKITQNL